MLKLIDITALPSFADAFYAGGRTRRAGGDSLPSGAGKSTLLNLIAGFLAPASGTLLIAGDDHTLTPPSRRPVSMLFQENNLFSHLNVQQNIGLGLNLG